MPRIAPLVVLLTACKPDGPQTATFVSFAEPARTLACTPTGGLANADGPVTYTSDDPEIAAVDAEGTITPGYIGTTTVRAEAVGDPSVHDEIAITVDASNEVFVDAAGDPATGDGHPDRPLRYVVLSYPPACPGGVVHLAAGVYPQVLGVGGSVTVRGPDVWPPTAILRPLETDYPGSLVGVLGDTVDFVLENVHVDGSAVEERVLQPQQFLWFRGILLDDGASATIRRSRFTGFRGEQAGDANGICVHANDSDLTVEDSSFEDCGWRAIDTFAVDGTPSGVITVTGSTFTGSDPAVSGAYAYQTGIVLRDGVTGAITGNTFEGFGPAGPANPTYGGARVGAEGAIGWAVDLDAAPTLTGNTFTDLQGAVRLGEGSDLAASDVLASNTVTGLSLLLGPAGEAAEVRLQRTDDPNALNAALLDVPCGALSACEVTLSPGAIVLTEDLVDPAATVTLVSSGATTVSIPNATVPAHVVAGAGVTITPTP